MCLPVLPTIVARNSPFKSSSIASVQTSEYLDKRAAEYGVGSGSASFTTQSGTFVFSRPLSLSASNSRKRQPPRQDLMVKISPAAASRLSALVCAVVFLFSFSSPSPGLTSALLVGAQQAGSPSGSKLHRQELTRHSHPEMKCRCRAIRCWPLMCRSAPHLWLANRRPLASSGTTHGVGEEFSSPIPAVESSGRNQSHPSLPAQAHILAPSPLAAPVSIAVAVAAPLLQALHVASFVSTTLFSPVSIHTESLGFSISGPR